MFLFSDSGRKSRQSGARIQQMAGSEQRDTRAIFSHITDFQFFASFFFFKKSGLPFHLNLYFCANFFHRETMYWTLELASYLEDAPWPATKDELIDFSIRTGAPMEVVENLQELEDDGQPYENIEEIWPDYPTKDDFLFNEDEY
jgi:hypothetical protein